MSRSAPLGVGVIGCGNISNQYLRNLTRFPDVTVVSCTDLDAARARAQAATYGVPHWGSPADALAHPGVQLIVNVLEMMTAIERSAVSAAFEPVQTRFPAPAPLDTRWDPYVAAN